MSWHDSFCAFDTETTGFGPEARILELGVVTFEGGQVVHEWSTLLCPEGVDWADPKVLEALKVNGLTREELVGKPTFEQVLPDLALELASTTWVAHNAEFDERMLRQEFQRMNHPGLAPALMVCTKNLAAHLNGQAKGNRLEHVAARFSVPQVQAHRATDDARVCGEVLLAMLRAGHVPRDDGSMRALCQKAAAVWRGKHQW